MFENELLQFYKKSMSTWFFLFKPIKIRFNLFVGIHGCSIIGILIFLMQISNAFSYILFVLYLILFFFSFIYFIFKPSRNKLLEKYNIDFRGEEFLPFRHLLLKEFLRKRKVIKVLETEDIEKSKSALDFYITKLEQELERKKQGRFLNLVSSYITLIIAFVSPVWGSLNNWIYMHKDHHFTFGQAFGYFGIMFF